MIASYVWLARLDTLYHVYILLEFKIILCRPSTSISFSTRRRFIKLTECGWLGGSSIRIPVRAADWPANESAVSPPSHVEPKGIEPLSFGCKPRVFPLN